MLRRICMCVHHYNLYFIKFKRFIIRVEHFFSEMFRESTFHSTSKSTAVRNLQRLWLPLHINSNGLRHTNGIRIFNLNGWGASRPCDLSLRGSDQYDTMQQHICYFSTFTKNSIFHQRSESMVHSLIRGTPVAGNRFSSFNTVRQSHRCIKSFITINIQYNKFTTAINHHIDPRNNANLYSLYSCFKHISNCLNCIKCF